MEIEIVVADDAADSACATIISAVRIGDGRVFVLPVTESYRIRAGELDTGV